MKLYTALDVSLRSAAICIVNENGVQYETKVEPDVSIVACLQLPRKYCGAWRQNGDKQF